MWCRQLHRWDVDCTAAAQIQRDLRAQLALAGEFPLEGLIAGVDASYARSAPRIYAAVAVFRVPEMTLVETAAAAAEAAFPYVPGYLSFREAPAVLRAFEKLDRPPDAVMVDAHGLSHPRRFGLACHLGLLLDLPTLGCAKSRLIGEHREPGTRRGGRQPLVHDGQVVGAVLRTRDNVKPVFVSQGHRVALESAVRAVLECSRGFRLPEPTRAAHRLANLARQQGQA